MLVYVIASRLKPLVVENKAAAKQSHPNDMEEIASGGWSHPFQVR